jgi:hypothetical protein
MLNAEPTLPGTASWAAAELAAAAACTATELAVADAGAAEGEVRDPADAPLPLDERALTTRPAMARIPIPPRMLRTVCRFRRSGGVSGSVGGSPSSR